MHFDTLNELRVLDVIAHVFIVSTLRKPIAKQFELIVQIDERRKNESARGSSNLSKY